MRMQTITHMVEDFNRSILDLPIPHRPKRLSEKRKHWAMTALAEELNEFYAADTIEEEADALIDMVYFAIGRAVEMGFDFERDFERVHAANMKKVRGSLSKRPGSLGYDAVKPDGWKAPTLHLHPLGVPLRLLVVGHGRHGKDTVCEMLRDKYGYRFQSSSQFCAEHVVFPRMPQYNTAKECFDDRANHRQEWFDIIREYTREDPTRLGREIFASNDIYCGVRSLEEFKALKAAGIFDACVWVDACGRLPLEPSCELSPRHADFFVNNNGAVDELDAQVTALARRLENR